MNRLFAKIFLWFWLTTVTVVLATAIAMLQFEPSRLDALRDHFRGTQAAHVQAAESILKSQGVDGVRRWMRDLRGRRGPHRHFQLLNEAAVPVFGPPPAQDIVSALQRESTLDTAAIPNGVLVNQIHAADNEAYWFVSDMRALSLRRAKFPMARFLGGKPPSFGPFYLRLLVAIFVSGLVSYALARYLTTPIRRMQTASAEIAKGNFAARVPNSERRDELGELSRDFNRMAEQLERFDSSQQQLLRDVSHELRSPLARLQVAVGLARQRRSTKVASELDRIEHEAETLEHLIAQLLSVVRLESGAIEINQDSVSIDELIDLIVHDANYEGHANAKSVIIDGHSGAIVRGDYSMLKSALENVVRNALRYTLPNTTVDVRVLNTDTKNVSINVRDHGPGVAPELVEHLFKPFVRGDYSRDRASGGYGIGLAIASAAIRQHAGNIRATNHKDGGLCVEIVLPRE